MDQRDIIGARVAARDTLQHKAKAMLVTGKPIVTCGPQDVERLEFELRKQHRELTDGIKRFKVVENHGRQDGLLEHWRRRDVEVYGCHDVHPGQPVITCGQHAARDWQLQLADDDATPIAVCCNPRDFETVIRAFEDQGFPVVWAEDLTRPESEARRRSLPLGVENPFA